MSGERWIGCVRVGATGTGHGTDALDLGHQPCAPGPGARLNRPSAGSSISIFVYGPDLTSSLKPGGGVRRPVVGSPPPGSSGPLLDRASLFPPRSHRRQSELPAAPRARRSEPSSRLTSAHKLPSLADGPGGPAIHRPPSGAGHAAATTSGPPGGLDCPTGRDRLDRPTPRSAARARTARGPGCGSSRARCRAARARPVHRTRTRRV